MTGVQTCALPISGYSVREGGFEKDTVVWSPLVPEGHWFVMRCRFCQAGGSQEQGPQRSITPEGSSVRVGGGRVDRLVVQVSRMGVGPVSGCCVCSVRIEGCWGACPMPRVGSAQTSTSVRVGGVAFLEPVGLAKGA